jgi:hypothetical protein
MTVDSFLRLLTETEGCSGRKIFPWFGAGFVKERADCQLITEKHYEKIFLQEGQKTPFSYCK